MKCARGTPTSNSGGQLVKTIDEEEQAMHEICSKNMRMRAVCSLGLPQANWASVNPGAKVEGNDLPNARAVN